ncbi:hypothetical protein CRG98_015961 [Punica granatum]|uniref:Uncharacterized protein n=1 Tax=Punica granatum TaxID=22663 RepID=A0A2I0K691_PUNGR|nr:hypothetical protein CRG98_015961 [Punica granatum]
MDDVAESQKVFEKTEGRTWGRIGQGPDPAEGSSPALDPSNKVARVQPPCPRGREPTGEPPNGSGPSPLFSCFLIEKRGRGEGGPTWPGAPPPALNPLGETATSRWRGRGSAREPPTKGGPDHVGGSPTGLNLFGETATSPEGSRLAGEPLAGVGPLPTPKKFWAKISKMKRSNILLYLRNLRVDAIFGKTVQVHDIWCDYSFFLGVNPDIRKLNLAMTNLVEPVRPIK